MILNVKSFLKSAVADYFITDTAQGSPCVATARRVGPERVIFTARLSSAGNVYELGKILLQAPICSYGQIKPNEEPVVVHLNERDAQASRLASVATQKRATLKVKPDTKWLSVIYVDSGDRKIKAEQIRIE